VFRAIEAPGSKKPGSVAPVEAPLTILDEWEVSSEEFTRMVGDSPSLRGFMIGYVGEFKLRHMLAGMSSLGLALLGKPDDHDRSGKGDIHIRYKSRVFTIELKSLQTAMVRQQGETFFGKAQCDASDRRRVKLPNGRTIETTCLLVGEFDVLGVNLYAFRRKWDFIFALNRDLPRSRYKGYSRYVRNHLLATLVEVTWPPREPFTTDLIYLLKKLRKPPSRAV
jgi:hypothetical protein